MFRLCLERGSWPNSPEGQTVAVGLGHKRDSNSKGTAVIRVCSAFYVRVAPMDHGYVLDNGKTQTGSARITAAGSINAVETLK